VTLASRYALAAIFYDSVDPEGEANYIDRHRHVDTNYLSSGGPERMK